MFLMEINRKRAQRTQKKQDCQSRDKHLFSGDEIYFDTRITHCFFCVLCVLFAVIIVVCLLFFFCLGGFELFDGFPGDLLHQCSLFRIHRDDSA